MHTKLSIDIETFDTPETNGYDIVIPNYAVVPIPPKPEIEIPWFVYVKMPIQPQIDKGLHVGAGSMDFWFNQCRKNYPNALDEVTSTFTMTKPKVDYIFFRDESYSTDNVMELWDDLKIDRFGNKVNYEVWGNGCNFDCSILQANHIKQFGRGDLWDYNAPQNARSVKGLLSKEEREEMDEIVFHSLRKFTDNAAGAGYSGLELHHPVYDAAREAIQISYCLSKKRG